MTFTLDIWTGFGRNIGKSQKAVAIDIGEILARAGYANSVKLMTNEDSPYQFSNALGHEPYPCTDNAEICQRCGSHVGNHDSHSPT